MAARSARFLEWGLAALAGAGICIGLGVMAPAAAQFRGIPVGSPSGVLQPPLQAPSTAPQPIEIQALDPQHFVVATREPRLVTLPGKEGAAQNMLVTVVTYYTVAGGRLVGIEHVRVPMGYKAITIVE
jgi:hypothetical protein